MADGRAMTAEERVLYETAQLVADGRTIQRHHATQAADILRNLAETTAYTGATLTRSFLIKSAKASIKGWTW